MEGTTAYKGVEHGDWVDCRFCGRRMLLPCGAERCPECGCEHGLTWVDEEQEKNVDDLENVLWSAKELKPYEYLGPEGLKELYPEIYQRMVEDGSIRCCKVCGNPMSDGYYCDGQFYCCDECLHKDYTQAEIDTMMYQLEDGEKLEDLSDGERDTRFFQQDVCYYTEWDSCYNM